MLLDSLAFLWTEWQSDMTVTCYREIHVQSIVCVLLLFMHAAAWYWYGKCTDTVTEWCGNRSSIEISYSRVVSHFLHLHGRHTYMHLLTYALFTPLPSSHSFAHTPETLVHPWSGTILKWVDREWPSCQRDFKQRCLILYSFFFFFSSCPRHDYDDSFARWKSTCHRISQRFMCNDLV